MGIHSTHAPATAHVSEQRPLRSAALVAGFGLLLMVITSPVAELYVFPKLIAQGDAAETAKRIAASRGSFVLGMVGYLATFIADVVVAWALYIYLRPVHQNLSVLTAIFRLVYAAIALVALAHLATIYRIFTTSTYSSFLNAARLNEEVMLQYYSFKTTWYFGILFFAIHLALLGYLAVRSTYIPKLFGILLFISAAGYLATTIQPYVLPGRTLDFAKYTFYGELFFMLWLLISGWRVKQDALR